jgi:hypothetical protein
VTSRDREILADHDPGAGDRSRLSDVASVAGVVTAPGAGFFEDRSADAWAPASDARLSSPSPVGRGRLVLRARSRGWGPWRTLVTWWLEMGRSPSPSSVVEAGPAGTRGAWPRPCLQGRAARSWSRCATASSVDAVSAGHSAGRQAEAGAGWSNPSAGPAAGRPPSPRSRCPSPTGSACAPAWPTCPGGARRPRGCVGAWPTSCSNNLPVSTCAARHDGASARRVRAGSRTAFRRRRRRMNDRPPTPTTGDLATATSDAGSVEGAVASWTWPAAPCSTAWPPGGPPTGARVAAAGRPAPGSVGLRTPTQPLPHRPRPGTREPGGLPVRTTPPPPPPLAARHVGVSGCSPTGCHCPGLSG